MPSSRTIWTKPRDRNASGLVLCAESRSAIVTARYAERQGLLPLDLEDVKGEEDNLADTGEPVRARRQHTARRSLWLARIRDARSSRRRHHGLAVLLAESVGERRFEVLAQKVVEVRLASKLREEQQSSVFHVGRKPLARARTHLVHSPVRGECRKGSASNAVKPHV